MSLFGSVANNLGANTLRLIGSNLPASSARTSLFNTANNITSPFVNINGKTNPGVYAVPGTGSYSQSGVANEAAPTSRSTGAGVSSTLVNDSINSLNDALGRLDTQAEIGKQNIGTQYNSALNTLNQAKANNEKTYNDNRVQTQQGYISAKNTIGTNTGNALNSLLRLLGAKGAGGSSAALVNAPQAAARQGTLQRTEAGNTFSKNMQGLDTGWNQYLQGYNSDLTNLNNQRINNENDLMARINTTRSSLLEKLAQLTGGATSQDYINQAKGLLSQADQLGREVPVMQVNPTVYSAPSLDSYTVNPNAAPTIANSAAVDYASPFLSLLLNKRQDQMGL